MWWMLPYFFAGVILSIGGICCINKDGEIDYKAIVILSLNAMCISWARSLKVKEWEKAKN